MSTNMENQFLQQFKGKSLSSVEFVQDYVQLRFDGSTLTAYIWPYLQVGSQTFSWGDLPYKDSLCARIGVQVKDASFIDGRDLTIWFEDGAMLKISLRDEDYRGPEALQFVNDQGSTWVV